MVVTHALATTAALTGVSICAKMLAEVCVSPTNESAIEMFQNAMYWDEVTQQDANAIVRLEHAAMAYAWFHAARAVAGDRTLERSTGACMTATLKTLERSLQEARAAATVTAPRSAGAVQTKVSELHRKV
jgi:hypothetical protein